MGGKSSPPPPPDYTPIANASKEAAQLSYKLGSEQLAWAKETYADNKIITDKVVDTFLRSQDLNMESAQKDRARYERLFQPLEDQLAADAADYSSGARKDLEMGRAAAGVAQQFDAARESATRNLEAYGIDPSSTRYAALDLGMRTQQAATSAAAQNQASQQTDAIGRALRSEAINVGRGYPGQIAGQYGTALQSGTGGVNSTLAQTASGANTMGTNTQYMGLANQSLGTWANALNMGYQNQLAAWKADQDQSSGWGSALGLIGGIATKFIEDGGAIEDGTTGGHVPAQASPTGGAAVDDVPARLNVGEFVFPKDVMQWKGEEWAQKEIQKARQAKQQGTVAKPTTAMAPPQNPTFVSRPQQALPLG